VDDSHAAENYIAALWTLRIDRHCPQHATLHTAISGLLKAFLDPAHYLRLTGKVESTVDLSWTDKIPTPDLSGLRDDLSGIIDVHVKNTDLRYPWAMLREHIHACHLYLTANEILLRPIIPPTWTHAAFATARQRIYMSATLGAGGDLERLTGRKRIKRIPVPEGWDRQGIGRRFFIFPGMGLQDADAISLRRDLMKRAGRSLVLVPSDKHKDEIISDVEKTLEFAVFRAEDIEDSKKKFAATKNAVAVVANRYDGIDFPGDDCRLLFIDGLPRATNAQERFLMSKMGANVLFNERILTRVLQAIGRCTRSLQDYSAVIVSGEELPDYLTDRTRRSYLHPELQAELDFGIEQSKGATVPDLLDNFDVFIQNDKAWEEANEQILAYRATAVQHPFPAMDNLLKAVCDEIEFQERLWQGDYEMALASAESVIGKLNSSELRGYRALWHYLAGSAAWLGGQQGNSTLMTKARNQFGAAKKAAPSIPWLVDLARYQVDAPSPEDDRKILFCQIERVEAMLTQLGTVHDRKYDMREQEILSGLESIENGPFENAHRLLGEMLGFEAGKEETDGSPDPWWIAETICFVFEDHAGALVTSALDVTKARQASSHPNWIKAHVALKENAECLAVLVTPVSKVKKGAVPHLQNVALWSLDEFKEWAKNALAIVREIRRTFSEQGDLVWRAQAAEAFENACLDAVSLFNKLKGCRASENLDQVN
jgi:hypothetical protein